MKRQSAAEEFEGGILQIGRIWLRKKEEEKLKSKLGLEANL